MTIRRSSRLGALLLSLALLTALIFSYFLGPAFDDGPVFCLFRQWTGLPCPGCGLTRSVCSISHGDFSAAWAYNPFGFFFYGLALVLIIAIPLYAFSDALRRWLQRNMRWVVRLLWILLIAMYAYGTWRLVHIAGQLSQ
jgi:hypothetical protein